MKNREIDCIFSVFSFMKVTFLELKFLYFYRKYLGIEI